MDYSTEQLEKISEYAGYLLTITDIAALLSLDPDELKSDIRMKSSPVYTAYHQGKASTVLQLRKQELELAKVGSPLAVQLTAGYLLDMNDDEE